MTRLTPSSKLFVFAALRAAFRYAVILPAWRFAGFRFISLVLCAAFAGPLSGWSQSDTPPGVVFPAGPQWAQTTSYPGGPYSAGSCVQSDLSGQLSINCVGGTNNDDIWSAPINPSGIGAWQQQESYGEGGENNFLGCANSGSYLVCAGGGNLGGQTNHVTSDLWWAPWQGDGTLGGWNWNNLLLDDLEYIDDGKITNGLWNSSCFMNGNVFACVGGYIEYIQLEVGSYGVVKIPFEDPVNNVFLNPVGSNGPGAWAISSNNYGEPIAGQSCVTYNGYVYCVGGVTGSITSTWDVSDVWYAQLQSSGEIGPWMQTTSYGGGAVDGLSCTVVSAQIVCVGGNFNGGGGGSSNEVWTAPLSSSGVGNWTALVNYPENVWESSCFAYQENVTCIGGGTTSGNLSSAGSPIGGDTNVYTINLEPQFNLGNGQTCQALNGDWDGSTSTCAITSSSTIGAGATVNVLPGVTLAVGEAGNCLPGLVNLCPDSASLTNNGTIYVMYGGNFTNYGSFLNEGVIANAGNFVNQAAFLNYGSFYTTGTSASESGTFANEGSLLNVGLFAATSNQVGNVIVAIDSETCDGASPGSPLYGEVAFGNPFIVYGTWNASNSTCEIDPVPGLPQGEVITTYVPQNIEWDVPAGTTLLNFNWLEVNGEIDNFGTVVTQAESSPYGVGELGIYNLFNNFGTLVVNGGGVADVAGALSNTGTVKVQSGGSLLIAPSGTLTSSNSITLASGASLSNYGTVQNSGTVDNSGSIDADETVESSFVNSGNGSIVNQNGGTTDGSGGTVTGTIGVPTVDLTPSYCQQIGAQWMTVQNTCLITGVQGINLNANEIVKIPAGVTLLNYGRFDIQNKIDNFGTIINGGNFIIDTASQLVGTGGELENERGATISDFEQIDVEPYATFVNNGSFVIGLPNNSEDVTVTGGSLDSFGTFTNNGEVNNYFTLVSDNGSYAGASSSFLNNGTITDFCSGSFQSRDNGPALSGNAIVSGGCNTPPQEPTVVAISLWNAETNRFIPGNPWPFDVPMSLQAQIYPSTATGTLTFLLNGVTPLGTFTIGQNSAGWAGLTTDNVPAGTQEITAQYSGNSQYAASLSPPFAVVILSNSYNEFIGVATGDFEGDGKPDAAFIQILDNSVQVYHGNGDGTFSFKGAYTVAQEPMAIASADLNGDGKLDLAVATTGGGVSILLGNGDGTFQNAVNYPGGAFPSSIAVADFNGDGKPDIVLGNMASNFVTVLLGNGDGTFQSPINSTAANAPQWVSVGDFNLDGKLDIVTGSQVDKTVSVLLGNGDGTFQTPVSVIQGFVQPISIAVSDYNGDGYPDFAVADASTSLVSIYKGYGTGTFTAGASYQVSANPVSLIAKDFTGGGIPGLVMVSQGASVASVLAGNGDGTFQSPVTYPVAGDPASVAVANLAGNGTPYLVVANLNETDYSVVSGPFPGKLTPTVTISGGPFIYDATAHSSTCRVTNAGGETVAGTCALTYNGASNPPVNAGTYNVSATFTPTDTLEYSSVQGTSSLTIDQAIPTISVIGGSYTYNGASESATCSATGVGGVQVPGSCNIAYNSSINPPVNAETYTVAASFSSGDANYFSGVAVGTIVIAPALPVVTVTGGTFVYNGQPEPATCAATGLGGAAVSGACTFTYNGSPNPPVNGGAYSVSAAFASSNPNYSNGTGSGSITITPVSQSITFPPITGTYYVQGTANMQATASSGLPVIYTSITPLVCSTTAGSSAVSLLASGVCIVAANQPGNANYSAAAQLLASFTIKPASQTITFPAIPTTTLLTGTVNLNATASSGLPVSFASTTSSVCTVSGTTATLVSVGTCTVKATQAGNSNFKAAPAVSRSFTVDKTAQTINFAAPPATPLLAGSVSLSATASSELPVSFASTTPSICLVSGGEVTLAATGTCSIKATQDGNTFYAAAPAVTRSFAVKFTAQTITFAPLSAITYGATPFTVSATASSGLPVSFASTTPSVCSVSGDTVTLVEAGTCSIRATQAGNADYTAAPTVSRSFAVDKAAQTITFPTIPAQIVGANVTLFATASSGLPVTYESTTAKICSVSGNSATMLAAGKCVIAAHQTGNIDYLAAPQVEQSFTVSAD